MCQPEHQAPTMPPNVVRRLQQLHPPTKRQHFVANVCHGGVASTQMIINRRSWQLMPNVPHALLSVSWLCTTSTSGHTVADGRKMPHDHTSKAVAIYGRSLLRPSIMSLIVHCRSDFNMLRVERLMLRAVCGVWTTSSETWSLHGRACHRTRSQWSSQRCALRYPHPQA